MAHVHRTSRASRPRADLPLAPLRQFDASAFLKTDELELAGFMLMAGLAFNDLKDLAYVEGTVLAASPSTEELSATTPERGEYAGRRVYVHRVLVGLLNEVMEFIAAHNDLQATPAFKRCLKRMPRFAVSAWEALVEASQGYTRGGKGDRKLRSALVSIRSNVSFHYYQPRGLLGGYHEFSKSAEASIPAYVSLGQNAEASRFYFADAAAQAYLNSKLQAGSLGLEELIEYAGHVLDALRLLVEAYLRERRLI